MTQPKNCRRGHPKSKHYHWISGRMRCELCYKRSSAHEKERRALIEQRLREGIAVVPKWDWFDYAKQCDLEFATPPFLRKAPEILAYLQRNKVKP
jgi:hypothetical protein